MEIPPIRIPGSDISIFTCLPTSTLKLEPWVRMVAVFPFSLKMRRYHVECPYVILTNKLDTFKYIIYIAKMRKKPGLQ